MKFMIMVKADEDYEAGKPPSPELLAAMANLAEENAKAGIQIEMGGLLPSFAGAKVRASGGRLTVLDGPFAEAKELIGGYCIADCASKAEAIEMAKVFLKLHQDVLGPAYEGECEVRQMFDGDGCANGQE